MTVKIVFGKTGLPRFYSDVVFYRLFQITISHYSVRESLWTGEKEIVKYQNGSLPKNTNVESAISENFQKHKERILLKVATVRQESLLSK